MFDLGIDRLLHALPDIEDLAADDVRELLTGAFLDIVAMRDLGSDVDPGLQLDAVRRLATALELQAIFNGNFESEETRACAFVAAEALELVRDLSVLVDDTERERIGPIPAEQYAAMEAGALYLIAGFDANAAVAARVIDPVAIIGTEVEEAPMAARMASAARSFMELKVPPTGGLPEAPADLSMALSVRWQVFGLIAMSLDGHMKWLLDGELSDQQPGDILRGLARRLNNAGRCPDESHLAYLFGEACDATSRRALREVSADDSTVWTEYVARRSKTRPLLWPAAQDYVNHVLDGAAEHSVVNVPTGAGKSAVAELAIARELSNGWVLYLTPTNALAAQVTRDLDSQFGTLDDIEVKGFLGGVEYTELPGERIEDVQGGQILVMTPEKCSLALRQAPLAFEKLRLVVMDECHLLGDSGSRGVNAELTVSEVLYRAQDAKALFLSALVANPEELSAWLENATSLKSHVVNEPWRPTRTLRALLGIDPDRAEPLFEEASEIFNLDPKRKKVRFDAPVNLLASYQGAWESLDTSDYAVVPANLSVPLSAKRQSNGEIAVARGEYVNQAAAQVTTRLAESGQRVLTFLPANKHYSFSVAGNLPDLDPQPRSDAALNEIDSALNLAEYELGTRSILRELIARGVAVHTSAMLRDEQRASELAFATGQARALFATGTLAQGLNLPATAVVIGGTKVGDDRHLSDAAREEAARAQLLNAIGRAGRAYVASRSIGIVIPDRWIAIRDGDSPEGARNRAPFLAHPDASTEVKSRMQALIRTAIDDPEVQIGQLTTEEETAFTFLASSNAGDSQAVIRHSFGAFREGLDQDAARRVSETIRNAGQIFVESVDAPNWIVEASHISGIALPATGALYGALTEVLEDFEPESVDDWRAVLVSALGRAPWRTLSTLLPVQPFTSTEMEGLVAGDEQEPAPPPGDAITALERTLTAWMSGEALTSLSAPALDKEPGKPERGSGHALPKLIALTEHGFGFGMSRIAGALTALVAVGQESGASDFDAIGPDSRYALDLLPLAVRFGCDGRGSAAWYRWGFRRRRVAHMLAEAVPLPADLAETDLPAWIGARRRELLDGAHDDALGADQMAILESLRLAP